MSGPRGRRGLPRTDAALALGWGSELYHAVRKDEWHRLIGHDGELPGDHPLRCFIEAAKDLQAAHIGDNHNRRMRGIATARERMLEVLDEPPSRNPYYFHALRWLLRIDAKIRSLSTQMPIPDVFVVGQPLDPSNDDEVEVFRLRRDLIDIIDHDLDDDRRGLLMLTGQRRMGKTSLLKMLPSHLGTGTVIVPFNFQRLSGSDEAFRLEPHRYVVHNVTNAISRIADFPGLPTKEITSAWGTGLAWLLELDAILARLGRRVLIAIDEIEALQRGLEEGWARDLTFLDFLRAAGDSLHCIRFLLVSAHPLSSPRLGPRWSDRLISVLPRPLGPLARDNAEQLLRKPVRYFPSHVFDDEAVASILAQTGTHPYLIQIVGNEIVKNLNADRRRVATPRDVQLALDTAVHVANHLFSYLWSSLGEGEAELMIGLAHGAPIDHESAEFHALRIEFFVELRDGAPAFVFPLFGRWIRDTLESPGA